MDASNQVSSIATGAAYALAGAVAVCTVGALVIRKKLKPRNRWVNNSMLEGITVVITGGNSGIGEATAHELARRKANVMIACRTRDKSMAVIEKIKADLPDSPEVQFGHLDLSSLVQTQQFVESLALKNVDILINNAGVWGSPVPESADGIEQTFATNYVSHFHLSNLMIQKYSVKRVINVSSGLYPRGRINPDHLEDLIKVPPPPIEKDVYRSMYSTSKLAQIYHSKELAEKHPEITSVSVHPGLCYTDLARHVKPNSILLSILGKLLPIIIRTPEEGAQTSVYCCVEDDLQSGGYYGDCAKEELKEVACNSIVQEKLWSFTDELIKQKLH